MSAISVSQTINPKLTATYPEYKHEYRYIYQPLPGEPDMYLGGGWSHAENPLEDEFLTPGRRFQVYNPQQPDYKFEWEIVRVDLFLPQVSDTYSGVVFCFCRLINTYPRQHEDTGKPEVIWESLGKEPDAEQERKNKPTLMSQLKSIQIDAPEDFAANLDLYLSGEKSVK